MRDAYVVVAINGGWIAPSPAYWDGQQDWTQEQYAKVYYTRREVERAAREAKKLGLPDGATDVSDVTVVID